MATAGSKDEARAAAEARWREAGAKPWGDAVAHLDTAWTKLEARLAAGVLVAEILALCAWIALRGLSAEYQVGAQGDKNLSGLVFRALLGAVVFGLASFLLTRPKVAADHEGHHKAVVRQNVIVTSSVVVGLLSARLWVNGGVEYFGNLLNWMQSASLLMLIGGLRGVATRLTLWLALLGASLATANGKHINIDVVMRFLTPRMRIPVAVLGWLAAGVMCLAGSWGFLDHITIALFHEHPFVECGTTDTGKPKECVTPASEKIAFLLHGMGSDAFIVGRQLSLDLRSFPKVVGGTKYNGYLTNAEWDTWVSEGDWSAHFPAEQVQGLMAPQGKPTDTHIPAVSIPGGQEARGLLIKDADLIFPFGLLMIALRFFLRALLAISGHVTVDPDSAHKEEDEHPDGLRGEDDPEHAVDPAKAET
jgi:TRAP-type C4-dicarboxylate transport system permease small subunit